MYFIKPNELVMDISYMKNYNEAIRIYGNNLTVGSHVIVTISRDKGVVITCPFGIISNLMSEPIEKFRDRMNSLYNRGGYTVFRIVARVEAVNRDKRGKFYPILMPLFGADCFYQDQTVDINMNRIDHWCANHNRVVNIGNLTWDFTTCPWYLVSKLLEAGLTEEEIYEGAHTPFNAPNEKYHIEYPNIGWIPIERAAKRIMTATGIESGETIDASVVDLVKLQNEDRLENIHIIVKDTMVGIEYK